MQLAIDWSDVYASTLALYSGRAGGHRWLVAVTPEHAEAVAQALGGLEGKGETVLLVYAGLTPLEAALREQTDPVLGRGLAGVLVIDRALTGGPTVTVPVAASGAEHDAEVARAEAQSRWDQVKRAAQEANCLRDVLNKRSY